MWLIDTQVPSITIFYADRLLKIIKGASSITDEEFPQLDLTPQQIFQQPGLIKKP